MRIGRSLLSKLFWLSVLTLMSGGSASGSPSLLLAWTASPDADVAGYILYYGAASGNYNHTNYIANVTTATVTGLPEGFTYYFVVRATNTAGLESPPSNELVYTVDPFFPSWRAQYFASSDLSDPAKEATVWGDSADPDRDGRPNLLEYALGLSPIDQNDRSQGLATEVWIEGSNGYQRLTFNRRKNDARLIYVPQVSGDKQTWNSGSGFVQEVTVTNLNAEFDSVTWQDLTPITPGNPRYFQLKVLWSSN